MRISASKDSKIDGIFLLLNNQTNFNFRFNGEPIYAELSPVTDFREACCRQYELGGCTKGAFCNFMHLKPISRELRRKLYGGNRRSPPRRRGMLLLLLITIFNFRSRLRSSR
jgi:hypothetical protein